MFGFFFSDGRASKRLSVHRSKRIEDSFYLFTLALRAEATRPRERPQHGSTNSPNLGKRNYQLAVRRYLRTASVRKTTMIRTE